MPSQELRTSDLEAVNSMLACIGEAPVNTLSGDLTANVQIAVDLLRNTSRAVQSSGWNFNTEEDWELAREVSTNKVKLPANTLDVDLTVEDGLTDIVQRGDYLYDKRNHTFEFDFNPHCTLILFLPWDDLNEPTRNYIKIKAARIYQDQNVGSGEHHQFTAGDEVIAFAEFQSSDARNTDATIFDTMEMAGIVNRRRPRLSQFPS